MGIIRLAVGLLCFLLLVYYGSIALNVMTNGKALKLRKPFVIGKALIPFYYFFYLDNSDSDEVKPEPGYEIREDTNSTEESE